MTPSVNSASDKGTTRLVILLLLASIFFPTSLGSNISLLLTTAHELLLMAIYGYWLLRPNGSLGPFAVWNGVAICGLLIVFTFFSPFPTITYGTLMPYLTLATLLCVNIRWIELTPPIIRAFGFTSFLSIFSAVMILLGIPFVVDIFLSYYAAFYPDLMPYMMSIRKPVEFFGSHSTAAFFFFIFFWLNMRLYMTTKRILNLLFACLFILTMAFLLSSTAFLYFSISLTYLIWHFFRRKPLETLLALAVCSGALYLFIVSHQEVLNDLLRLITSVTSYEQGGLIGRYSSNGALAWNINYIRSSPFSPIGLTFRQGLFLGDSGPLEYLLRGSLFLLTCVYAGFWCFLQRNCRSRQDAILLGITFLLFEVGFSNLQYVRTASFLPVIVIILNGCQAPQEDQMLDSDASKRIITEAG